MIQNNYKYEAEMFDGVILDKVEFLDHCVRFSLIPQVPLLQTHCFTGIPMERRFCRSFTKLKFGDTNAPGYDHYHCIVCKDFRVYVRSLTGSVLITPKDFELYL